MPRRPAQPPVDRFTAAREAHIEAVRRALRRHGDGCVASHGTAAILFGLPVLSVPERPHLTRAGGSRRTTGRAHVHVADLRQEDVTEVRGLPVTAPARTVVDVARSGSFLAGLVTADAALARGLPASRLREVLLAQWNWPGIRMAASVVRAADGRAESPAESVVRGRCVALGLAVPVPQVWYALPSGGNARVDLDWPEYFVVGEADGRVKYTDPAVLWAEKQRRDELEEMRVVIRWTWQQALAPDGVFRLRLLAAFRRGERLRQLLGVPPASGAAS